MSTLFDGKSTIDAVQIVVHRLVYASVGYGRLGLEATRRCSSHQRLNAICISIGNYRTYCRLRSNFLSLCIIGIAMNSEVAVAGTLLEKEIEFIGGSVDAPKRPLVAILGGAKVSDKIG